MFLFRGQTGSETGSAHSRTPSRTNHFQSSLKNLRVMRKKFFFLFRETRVPSAEPIFWDRTELYCLRQRPRHCYVTPS